MPTMEMFVGLLCVKLMTLAPGPGQLHLCVWPVSQTQFVTLYVSQLVSATAYPALLIRNVIARDVSINSDI